VGRVIFAVICIVMLLASLYLFGLAFQVHAGQGFVFFGGIILMCLSFGLPIHAASRR
jgi:hypothetical protein